MEWESDSPCRSHTYPGQGRKSPGRYRGWELRIRDCGPIPGRGLLLTVERRIEGMWGRKLWGEMPVEESQAAMEARWYCRVTHRGWSQHHSLSPRTSISSWTTESWPIKCLALNHRVGTQPRGPLYVPYTPNNREGPQGREPSKCLNGQSYGERLAKEAFWSPATRGSKKDSDRAITPATEAVCVPAHLVPPGSPQAK